MSELTPVNKGLFSWVKRELEQYNDLSSGDLLLIWLVVDLFLDEYEKRQEKPVSVEPTIHWYAWHISFVANRLAVLFGFNHSSKQEEAIGIVKSAAIDHPSLNKHLLRHHKS